MDKIHNIIGVTFGQQVDQEVWQRSTPSHIWQQFYGKITNTKFFKSLHDPCIMEYSRLFDEIQENIKTNADETFALIMHLEAPVSITDVQTYAKLEYDVEQLVKKKSNFIACLIRDLKPDEVKQCQVSPRLTKLYKP